MTAMIQKRHLDFSTEVCDGVDDCDSSVDENVTTTYYRDLDSDGMVPSIKVLKPVQFRVVTLPTPMTATTCNSCYPGHQSPATVWTTTVGTVDEVNASGCVDYYQT